MRKKKKVERKRIAEQITDLIQVNSTMEKVYKLHVLKLLEPPQI